MSKQPQPAPTASAVGPWPTLIQISRTPGTGSLPSTIAPPDHPLNETVLMRGHNIRTIIAELCSITPLIQSSGLQIQAGIDDKYWVILLRHKAYLHVLL